MARLTTRYLIAMLVTAAAGAGAIGTADAARTLLAVAGTPTTPSATSYSYSPGAVTNPNGLGGANQGWHIPLSMDNTGAKTPKVLTAGSGGINYANCESFLRNSAGNISTGGYTAGTTSTTPSFTTMQSLTLGTDGAFGIYCVIWPATTVYQVSYSP